MGETRRGLNKTSRGLDASHVCATLDSGDLTDTSAVLYCSNCLLRKPNFISVDDKKLEYRLHGGSNDDMAAILLVESESLR